LDNAITLADLPEATGSGEVRVHPTAIVEKGAQLGKGVQIGPFCVVGSKAVLHDWVRLDSHVTVQGRTTIGERSAIYQFATIGVIPQDLKFRNEDTELVIGAENSIRQYVNISIGTEGGGGRTVIGKRNLLMVYVHVAHDCVIGDNCVFANAVSLAGHVTVKDHAFLGGYAAVHQFVKVGELAMLGGGSMVVQDVPPFVMVQGDRAAPIGLNIVGLKRAGFSTEEVKDIKAMYRLLYSENLTVEDCLSRIERDVSDSRWRKMFVQFIKASERGVCR
jgi:UDP-N-acetylglucosamine acyltransferase